MHFAFVVLSDGFEAGAELSTVLSFHYARTFTTDVANPVKIAANPVRIAANPVRIAANPVRIAANPVRIAANPVRGCMFIDTLLPESTSGRICEAAFR